MRTEPLRILIAEDETIIRLDLRGALEHHGFVVCAEARDGLEAVALAHETEPDVALLDLKMPQLDGIEAARRMYAERPLPIVMLTAYTDRRFVERAIDAGVFTYLVKPFARARCCRRCVPPLRGTRSCSPRAARPVRRRRARSS
jgi:response regulator NasT